MKELDRNNPCVARLKDRFPLTKESSTKDTWHVTLDMSGLDLEYHPGDSVAIFPKNDPVLVDHLIEALGATGNELILPKKETTPTALRNFLEEKANLSRLTSNFLKFVEKKDALESLQSPENKDQLRAFLKENDPLHLFRTYRRGSLPLQELCNQFGPLLPRFYSVASSRMTSPDTLDLTIALFTWEQNGEKRYGVASHFLCNLAQPDHTPIPLYVQPAPHFRLPEDHHKDIIMIGPGTGVAPFRAFMQERTHNGSKASHWLFFGERNQKSDYFYQSEWQAHPNLEVHTAFSRDQETKTYVQHRMLENGSKLYSWLEGGAHLYVCGDAKEMAKDVHKALVQIYCQEGGLTELDAKEKLKSLKKSGHYRLDVY